MVLTSLTQNQQWGLAYETQLRNSQVAQQNVQVEQQNKFLPRTQDLIPLKTVQTVEEYALNRLAEMGDQGYSRLIAVKEQKALQMFRALPPAEQAALVAQFGIPDVLQ